MGEPQPAHHSTKFETNGQRDLTNEEMKLLTRQDKIQLAKPRLKIKRTVFDSNLLLMGSAFTDDEATRLEEYGSTNGDLKYLTKLPECMDLNT